MLTLIIGNTINNSLLYNMGLHEKVLAFFVYNIEGDFQNKNHRRQHHETALDHIGGVGWVFELFTE